MQTNRADCYRLARRCLSLLVDIKDQLEGRWERAPDTLLKNVKRLEGSVNEAGTRWISIDAIHQYIGINIRMHVQRGGTEMAQSFTSKRYYRIVHHRLQCRTR